MEAAPGSGAHSHSKPPGGEGEGAEGAEKNPGKKGADAVGDSEEDGEDVFEVERILDMKTEGVRERQVRRAAAKGGLGDCGAGPPAASRRRSVRVGPVHTTLRVDTWLGPCYWEGGT